MHFIYLQQSGKPVDTAAGQFWTLAGVAIPEVKVKQLQGRVSGLLKSFQNDNYEPGHSRVNANDLLHPRNAERRWSLAFTKGFERIAANLGAKFFLVVVDKQTTDKPAHPKWLLPLAYHYMMRPIAQHLREQNSLGALVIPPGREEEASVLSELQVSILNASGARSYPIMSSPLIQREADSAGLMAADLVATIARRYHADVYPKLFAKQVLEGYDAVINSHYQGFVKPNTFQSLTADDRGFRVRGYIYLWRREGVTPSSSQSGDMEGQESESLRFRRPSQSQSDRDPSESDSSERPRRRYGPSDTLIDGGRATEDSSSYGNKEPS